MYKKNKPSAGKPRLIYQYIKRKVILVLAAIMMGISNAIYEEDDIIGGNQNYIEQEQEKDL